MLCAVCLSMFQNSAKSGLHHKDRDAVRMAAENGCRICHILTKERPHLLRQIEYKFTWTTTWRPHWCINFRQEAQEWNSNYPIYVHVSEATSLPVGYDQFIRSAMTDLETDPCRVQRDMPTLRDIPDNTGHIAVAELAKQWLQTCKTKHKCEEECGPREPGWYPKRLVHVGNEHQTPRLVLRDADHLDGAYAALSHCWGDNPEFLKLSSANLEEFRREILIDNLAASFRDTIITCRRLDIPYLWIDSLCILQSGQDSQEDWLLHTLEMHRVYRNCELNIAIQVSKNPHEGAFRSRNPEHLQDCCVWTPFFESQLKKNVDEDISAIPEPEQQPPDLKSCPVFPCAIFHIDDFSYSRRSLPLSKRAWVLQEKLMSPRTLHFQKDRIMWECEDKRCLSEYMPESAASNSWRGFDCLFQDEYNIHPRRTDTDFFYEYVVEYSDRKLNFPDQDKLVAFAAIAEQAASFIGGAYCAGIFRESMPWALLWRTSLLKPALDKRSVTYRAPSWSWASFDGRVNFGPWGSRKAMAEVNDVSIDLVDPTNQFGQVKAASLTLTGPLVSSKALLTGEIVPSEKEEGRPGLPTPPDTLKTPSGEHVTLVPDESGVESWHEEWLENWLLSKGELIFVAILDAESKFSGFWWSGTYGLMLRRLANGTYTRVGVWGAKLGFVEKHAQTACEFRPGTVTIV
ncbi:heterokaryon incompatibility protein-domain-containing protein [Thelonectria olida]|uniref:Heterokaryon incompatibility protein-domain-containing protein n=1 Tax=Thelonectria olida TaxID=1576542 RepID=A0A9P8VZ08_9HYPO|nr:heterokaryon incompatibility protein-domain-containing protein [Thelonectria olida]